MNVANCLTQFNYSTSNLMSYILVILIKLWLLLNTVLLPVIFVTENVRNVANIGRQILKYKNTANSWGLIQKDFYCLKVVKISIINYQWWTESRMYREFYLYIIKRIKSAGPDNQPSELFSSFLYKFLLENYETNGFRLP